MAPPGGGGGGGFGRPFMGALRTTWVGGGGGEGGAGGGGGGYGGAGGLRRARRPHSSPALSLSYRRAARIAAGAAAAASGAAALDGLHGALAEYVGERVLPRIEALASELAERHVRLGRVVSITPTSVEFEGVEVGPQRGGGEASSLRVHRVRVELLPWQGAARWRLVVRATARGARLRCVQQPARTWYGFPKPNELLIPEHKRTGRPRKTGRGVRAPPRPPLSAMPAPTPLGVPRLGAVALEALHFEDSSIEVRIHGDGTPRHFDRVDGRVALSPDNALLAIEADGLARRRGARRRARGAGGASHGGDVQFRGSLNFGTGEFLSTTKAQGLHAPLLEYGLDIPFSIQGGTLDGELAVNLHEGALFPSYHGTVRARGAEFTIDDAPSSFNGVDMDLVFEGERMYLHNASGAYGAINLKASGDMDLNPVWGQYRLTAQTTKPTHAMPFLKTVKARPPPYPLTAMLQGTVHINGPLEFPVLSGAAHAEPYTVEHVTDCAEQAVAQTPGAVAAYDKVPFSSASTTYVYDTASEVLELHGIKVEPVGGGVVTGGGSIWVSPCAEQDPTATDVLLTGTDLPADEVLRLYAPAAESVSGARVGSLRADIALRGAAIAPGIDVKFEAGEAKGALRGTRGTLSLNRQRISLNASADQFDFDVRLPVKYPPLSVLRQAWTREAAAAAAQPEILGCEMDARLHGVDVMALASGEDSNPNSAAHCRLSGRARYSGTVSVIGGAAPAPSAAAPTGGAQQRQQQQAAHPPEHPVVRMDGDLQLSGVRLNHLKLADRLRGSFAVDTLGCAAVDVRGRADEYLHARAAPPGAAAASTGTVSPIPSLLQPPGAPPMDLGERGGSLLSLRRGNMRLDAHCGPGLTHATVTELPLDDLEIASLRGVVESANVELDFMRRKGAGHMELLAPRFSGLVGESFTSGFKWAGDVVELEPTVLQQEISRYELRGQYEVPTLERRASAAAAAASSPVNTRESTGAVAAAAAAAAATAPKVGESARWAWELNVPVAEIAEALPAAQLLSQSTRGELDFGAAVGRTKLAFVEGVKGLGVVADELTQQLEIAAGLEAGRLNTAGAASDGAGAASGGGAKQGKRSSDAPTAPAKELAVGDSGGSGGSLPGLRDLRGRWQGRVEASGTKEGMDEATHTAVFDLRGAGWQWGAHTLQELAASGSFDSDTGLVLSRLQADSGDASLRMSGRLLGPEQNATFSLVEFPAPLLLSLARSSPAGAPTTGGGGVGPAGNLVELAPGPNGSVSERAPPISGALYVQGKVLGTTERPEAEVSVKLLDGAVGDTPLQKAEANAAVTRSRRLAFNALLSPATAPGHLRLAGSLPLPRGLVASTEDAKGSEGPEAEGEEGGGALAGDDEPGSASLAGQGQQRVALSDAIAIDCVVKDSGMLVMNAATNGEVQWLTGGADITLQVRGTVEDPVANGMANITRAAIDVPAAFPKPVTALGCSASIDRNVLRVRSLEGRCGRRGYVRASGALPLTPHAAELEAERLAQEAAADGDDEEVADAESSRGAAVPSPAALRISADSLEVRVRNAFTGQLDADIAVSGNAAAVCVGGGLRLSKGTVFLLGVTEKQEHGDSSEVGAKAAQASGPSAMGAAFSAPVHMGEYDVPMLRTPAEMLMGGVDGGVAGADGLPGAEYESVDEALAAAGVPLLQGLTVTLGPELRAVYPFVINFGIQGEIELEGYADPSALRPSGAIEFTSGEVNLVATQVRLNREHVNRAVLVPEHGLDPTLDVSLLGADLMLNVKGRASNWQDSLVLQYTGAGAGAQGADAGGAGVTGADSLSRSEAARVFEGQLAESLLEKDGQLAFAHLASSTIGTLLPKIETQGQYGQARWRLMSAPTLPNLASLDPLVDPFRSLAQMSLGAEMELTLGKCQALVERRKRDTGVHTGWSLVYRLTNRLRVLLARNFGDASGRAIVEYTQAPN